MQDLSPSFHLPLFQSNSVLAHRWLVKSPVDHSKLYHEENSMLNFRWWLVLLYQSEMKKAGVLPNKIRDKCPCIPHTNKGNPVRWRIPDERDVTERFHG